MNALAKLGAIIGLPTIVVLQVMLNGYVLSVLWGWFFIPVLQFPAIGIVQAIGISIIISYLTHQQDSYEDRSKTVEDKIIGALAFSALRPLLALFFGWIVRMFI
jgi:putative flippase GtrA